MTGDNPLVVEEKETDGDWYDERDEWQEGIGLFDSCWEAYKGVRDGNWVQATIGGIGAGLEGLFLYIDPAGTLLSYGISWAIEHIQPLSNALDAVAGDPESIEADSKTWHKVAERMNQVAEDYKTEVESATSAWMGDAADAYRKHAGETIDAIAASGILAELISVVVKMMGEVVAAVREMLRDIIADVIAEILVIVAEEACTMGAATPLAVSQLTGLMLRVGKRLLKMFGDLATTVMNLLPLLKTALKKLDEVAAAFKKLAGKGSDGSSPDGSAPDGNGVDNTDPAINDPGNTSPSSTSSEGTSPSSGASPGSSPDPGGTGPSSAKPHDGSSPDGASTPPAGSKSADGSTTPSTTKPNGSGIRDSTTDPRGPGRDPNCKSTGADPVDVVTGEVLMTQYDVELAGVLPLVLERAHTSSHRVGRSFGRSWSSTVDQRVEVDDRGVCFAASDGRLLIYPSPPADGSPVEAEEGARWPLRRTPDGGYTITRPEEGHELHFADGKASIRPLAAVTDRNGNRIDFHYDDDGAPAGITHSGGYEITVGTTGGLVTELRLRNPAGEDVRLVRYRYDAGRLVAVFNSSGQPMLFDYDDADRLAGWQDRNGEWYRYDYDTGGRCVRTEGSGGVLNATFEYQDRMTIYTNSLGHTTTYHVNELMQVVRDVDPLGNTTVSEWDRYDRLLARTDPLGRTTRFAYDTEGRQVATMFADGSRAAVRYNDLWCPIELTGPDGRVWRHEYDTRGNLVTTVDPSGATTRFVYNDRGHLVEAVDAVERRHRWETNAAGLPLTEITPSGVTTRYVRDLFGRTTSVVDPLGATEEFEWTVEGRLLSRTAPDGGARRWTYDGEGNAVEFTDQLGQTTRLETTHFDLPAVQVGPDGSRTEFGYDTETRLLSVTNPLGLVWSFRYDAAGNLVSETDFNDRTVQYTHDGAGQVVERTNGAGEITRLTRDLLGHVTERRSGESVARFEYDRAARIVRAVNSDADVVFEHDQFGRVVAETVNGRTITSRYDPVGRRLSRRTPTGAESRWEYGVDDLPIRLHTAGRTVSFDYDPAGREVSRRVDGAVLTQVWDSNNRLVTQSVAGGGGELSVAQQRRYHYRADNNITAIEDGLSGTRRFEFDVFGRVTAVRGAGWQERYAYDAIGNVTQAVWPRHSETDEGHRQFAGSLINIAGQARYRHDAQGRMVLRQPNSVSGEPDTWQYTWDAEDHLTDVVTPDATRWRYRYDAMGRRVAKQRLAQDGIVVEQLDFVWDGTYLAEQTHSGGLSTTWDWAPGEHRPLTQIERVTTRDMSRGWVDRQFYAVITDVIGTPVDLVDPSGKVVWHAHTSLWGEAFAPVRQDADTPLRFPGQYFDRENGLSYNVNRYYDAYAIRYVSPDPLGLEPAPNPHGYVSNPTVWFDRLGLAPEGCRPSNYKGKHRPDTIDSPTAKPRPNGGSHRDHGGFDYEGRHRPPPWYSGMDKLMGKATGQNYGNVFSSGGEAVGKGLDAAFPDAGGVFSTIGKHGGKLLGTWFGKRRYDQTSDGF